MLTLIVEGRDRRVIGRPGPALDDRGAAVARAIAVAGLTRYLTGLFRSRRAPPVDAAAQAVGFYADALAHADPAWWLRAEPHIGNPFALLQILQTAHPATKLCQEA